MQILVAGAAAPRAGSADAQQPTPAEPDGPTEDTDETEEQGR